MKLFCRGCFGFIGWMDVVVSKEDDDDVYEEEYGYGYDGHGQLTGPRAEAKLAFLGFS